MTTVRRLPRSHLPKEEDDRDTAHWLEQAGREAVLVPGDLADPAYCPVVVGRAEDSVRRRESARISRPSMSGMDAPADGVVLDGADVMLRAVSASALTTQR